MKSGSISGKKSGVSKRKLVKNLKTMRKSAGTVLKIFIGYAQIMSVSNTAFKIPWTGGFLTFLRVLSPLNLDFLSASGLGCVMKFDFFLNHMTMMLVPLIVFSFVAVAYITGYYFHDRKFGSHFTTAMKSSYKNHVLYFVMWMKLTGDSIYEKTTRSSAFRAISKLRKYNVYFDVALVSMNVSVVLFAAWAIFPGAMLYAIICRKQKGVEPRRSLSERLVIAGLKNRDNMTRVIPSDSVETPDTGTKAQVWVEEKS
eukprot:g8586.t1